MASIPENMEVMFKTLANEKLGLERQLQVAKQSIEDLKVISFKNNLTKPYGALWRQGYKKRIWSAR